jgi:hypothetical protein
MLHIQEDTTIFSYRCENLKFYCYVFLKVKIVSLSLIGKLRDMMNILLFQKRDVRNSLKLNKNYFN